MIALERLLLSHVLVLALVLARIAGLMAVAPVFGSQSVPRRVRALLAVALSLLIVPAQLGRPMPHPGTLLDFVGYLASETMIGLALGLGVLILFAGVQVAGQIIGQLSGTGLSEVFDPAFDNNSVIHSQLLFFVALAIFCASGGHRIVMGGLLDTFSVLPPGAAAYRAQITHTLVSVVSQSFHVGIRAAAPVMAALLLSTFILGLVSRTLPQLNILAVGFGLNSIVTQAMLMLSLGGAAWAFQDQLVPIVDALQQAITGAGS